MKTLRRALLLACAIATGAAAQTGGKQFVPPAPGQNPPYTPAIAAGGLIYVAGLTAPDKPDIKTQTAQVLDDIDITLQKAGSSLENVAYATVMVRNVADLPVLDEVLGSRFTGTPPARTIVIAPLMRQEALVEIM